MGALERQAREIQIIDSAAKIFAIKGFGSTKIKDIAKEAGVSVGIVYFYYKNKEELYLAVVLKAIELSVSVINEAKLELEHKNCLEQLMGIVKKYLAFSEQNFQFQEVISTYISLTLSMRKDSLFHGITEGMKSSPFFEKLQQNQWSPALLIMELIHNGQEEGSIENNDMPQLIFANLWALIIGFEKLYLPDFELVDKAVFIPKINSKHWKNSLLNMIHNYLKS